MKKALIVIMGLIIVGAGAYLFWNKRQTTTTIDTSNLTNYTLMQVAEHSTENDCYMAIDGYVYDATSYIPQHRNPQILSGCGKDSSQMFAAERKHNGREAQSALKSLIIGMLIQ